MLLDLGLPDMDGLDVCEQIRLTSTLPIVVLTADGDSRRKVEALDLGADDYVTKPFSMPRADGRGCGSPSDITSPPRPTPPAQAGFEPTTRRIGNVEIDSDARHGDRRRPAAPA